MAASTQISLDVYMRTSYRPDREYIDGEVREKDLGKWEHARFQILLGIWFGRHESLWRVMGSSELRVQVSATRVRLPDFTVVAARPLPQVLVDPPLLIVEILSGYNTYTETQNRASDYLQMGVKNIWIVDPESRTGRMYAAGDWITSSRLDVPGSSIYVDLPDLFQYLDKPVV